MPRELPARPAGQPTTASRATPALQVMPPLTIAAHEVDEVLERLEAAVAAVEVK